MNSRPSINESPLGSRAWLVAGSLILAVALFGFQPRVFAGDPGGFAGAVRDQNGRPISGAMITVTSRDLDRGTSVFAAKDGGFRMPALEAGLYDLRVRRVGYKDLSSNAISLRSPSGGVILTMSSETDPNELAWQLPANRWTPLVLDRLSNDG